MTVFSSFSTSNFPPSICFLFFVFWICSSALATSHSSTSIGTPSHTSPVPFSAPQTPSYTPCCTPRRLSLSHSLTESSTNLRDSTKTTSTSLGLVRLLLERGISASVYNPCSWDRALDAGAASTITGRIQEQTCTAGLGGIEVRLPVKRPNSLLLQPSTPPSSPHSKSYSSTAFQFSPVNDDLPYHDAFLASKPARVILREVLGELEREGMAQADDDNQTEITSLGLVDKLKCFPTLSPHSASGSSANALLPPFGATAMANNVLGGGLSGLNTGLRRNRSYPALVGASMAMKDPGGPPCTLMPHTKQNSPTQDMEDTKEMEKSNPSVVRKVLHIPQTLNALKTVQPQSVVQRHTRADCRLQGSLNQDFNESRT